MTKVIEIIVTFVSSFFRDMLSKIFFLLILSLGLGNRSYSQISKKQGKDYLRLMFYNMENFFDTVNDSSTNDNDFTPEGIYHWTQGR